MQIEEFYLSVTEDHDVEVDVNEVEGDEEDEEEKRYKTIAYCSIAI